MLRKIAATVAIVGVLAGLGTIGALSKFTSTVPVDENTFTAGTVNISPSPATEAITYDNMAPGDVKTEPLIVTHGSLALRYAVTSLADNDDDMGLRDQLVFTIKTVDVTTPITPCDDFDGTQLYTGVLGGDPAINVIGDPTTGHQAGDRYLSGTADTVDADGTYPPGPGLDAPIQETLCLQVSLPSDTPNSFEGATTTATFTFSAEQRRNNP